MKRARNILVIRNDKLGDFMLVWPALSLLKKQYPDCTITVLVPSYTEPMAQLCPWIDNVILDDQHKSLFSDARKLARKFRQNKFDASISMYTEARTALATLLAGIPCRVSPATKVAQIYSNQRLRQRRSTSSKPEHEYNTDLARYFIGLQADTPASVQSPPYLRFDDSVVQQLRNNYVTEHKLSASAKLVLVHPGSGGSAVNLSVTQYAKMIMEIGHQSDKAHFIITAGPGEENTANELSSLIKNTEHSVYISRHGLVAFSQFIAMCDVFISGSTGTLHIAGALDIPTVAFYSARQSATSLRWQTLNRDSTRISFSPDKYTGEEDMQTLDPVDCARRTSTFIEQLA